MKLSKLLERLEEDAERDAMLAQMVKNPETGQDITVKTALGYDKTHPARQAAAKIYAQFMAKRSARQPAQNKPTQQVNPQARPAQKQFTPRPKPNYRDRYRSMQNRRNPYSFGSDDGYDAMRDMGLTRSRYDDPFYDPQDYR